MKETTHGLELHPAPPVIELLPDGSALPWWMIVVLLSCFILITVFFVLKKRQSSAGTPPKMRDSAYRSALAALAEIRSAEPRDAAVRSSLIIRKYLSIAADDPALFETHEEFIARQDALKALNDTARAAAESGFTRIAALKYGPENPAIPAADIISESRALLETLHHGFNA